MEHLIQFIGAYAGVLLIGILVIILITIALLWRWLERSSHILWKLLSDFWRWLVKLPPFHWLRQHVPWLWQFLGHRLSPQGYLGLHLTLGLIWIMLSIYFFAELADAVLANEDLVAFDLALTDALYAHMSSLVLQIFLVITHLGDPLVLAALAVVVGLLLMTRRYWILLASWIITLACGGLLNVALKDVFQRTRPGLPDPFITASGWSFPSGHAMGSLITYGMLAYLLVLMLDRRWHRLIVICATALILLIGVSRIYLGVHYFSDVLAAYTAGTAWLATCVTGTEVARRQRQQQAQHRRQQQRVESV